LTAVRHVWPWRLLWRQMAEQDVRRELDEVRRKGARELAFTGAGRDAELEGDIRARNPHLRVRVERATATERVNLEVWRE
jgi:hypothetical protein